MNYDRFGQRRALGDDVDIRALRAQVERYSADQRRSRADPLVSDSLLDIQDATTKAQSTADAAGVAITALGTVVTGIGTSLTAETARATTAEATKAPLASPAFTGAPTAPTPAATDNSTTLATTAFVHAQGYSGVGAAASRPATLSLPAGVAGLYFATDTLAFSIWTGSAWVTH